MSLVKKIKKIPDIAMDHDMTRDNKTSLESDCE